MKTDRRKVDSKDIQAILVFIGVIIQVAYSGITLLKFAGDIFDIDVRGFTSKEVLLAVSIYAFIIISGVLFLMSKVTGWYCTVSLYVILFLRNAFIIVTCIFINVFRPSLLKIVNPLFYYLNSYIIWAILMLIVSGIMIKLLFNKDTILEFELKINLEFT